MSSSLPTPPAANLTIPEALNRAHAHWNAGQAAQAEQLCLRVLEVLPEQPDARHLLGVMAHAYGNLDLAVTYLRAACASPAAPAPYLSNLAEMLRQQGLTAEGEKAAQRAVALDPSLASAWNNLGILQQETGQYDASRASLQQAIALQPDWAQAHNNLANTFRRLGLADQAAQHYQRALELDPGYAEAYSNLAHLLCALGQPDRGAAAARHAIELNPGLTDAYLNLAEAELMSQRPKETLAALDALQAFAPQHPAGIIAREKVLQRLNRQDAPPATEP